MENKEAEKQRDHQICDLTHHFQKINNEQGTQGILKINFKKNVVPENSNVHVIIIEINLRSNPLNHLNGFIQ